jgi:Notch-like protein
MNQTSHPPHFFRALGVLAPLALALAGCSEAPSDSSPEHTAAAKQNLTTCTTIQRGVGSSVVSDVRITQSQPAVNLSNQTLMVDKFSEVLIKFTLPALPQSAVLNSATMTLYPTIAGGGPINIHSVLLPWSETAVTFTTFNQKFTPAIAAVFAPTASATLKSVDVTALAQAWISGAQVNNGLLLETTSTVATYIMSSKAGINSAGVDNSALRPSLTLCYTTPNNNCAPNPCQNGASCQNLANGFTCACPPGFTGATCQTNIDDCSGSPCLNGGACTDGVNSYTCACAPGYTGANCQTDINECAPAPCQNGGICTDSVNSYSCACPPGFTGTDCQINVDDCAFAPCVNGGTCTDGVNTYSCACPPGYTGVNCEIDIDDCVGNACQNGSSCIDGIAAYTCSCPPGYNGSFCEINIDECSGAPCLNGGSCTDGFFSYTCACAAGFTGTNCEIDINDCAGAPCVNAGICVDGVNSYTCQCPVGFTGTNCETPVVVLCDPSTFAGDWQGHTATLVVNATTVDGTWSSNGRPPFSGPLAADGCSMQMTFPDDGVYSATMKDSCTIQWSYVNQLGTVNPNNTWSKDGCIVDIDFCAVAPCQNGGTCVDGTTGYTCQCAAGFGGTNCELSGACVAAPCQGGGTCVNNGNSYDCSCPFGLGGQNCDVPWDSCASNPCGNGGTCSPVSPLDYVCSCPPGLTGPNCQDGAAECGTADDPCTAANVGAGNLLFASAQGHANYVQCLDVGQCTVQLCPDDQTWSDTAKACAIPTVCPCAAVPAWSQTLGQANGARFDIGSPAGVSIYVNDDPTLAYLFGQQFLPNGSFAVLLAGTPGDPMNEGACMVSTRPNQTSQTRGCVHGEFAACGLAMAAANTNAAPVPDLPLPFAFLGTGVLGLAAALRRRFAKKSAQ